MNRLSLILYMLIGCCALAMGTARVSNNKGVSTPNEALYNYFYMEGEIQYNLGNYDAAFALMQEAHRIDPSALTAQYNLAQYYMQLGKTDRALQLLERVSEGDTTHYWYNLSYASTLMHLKQNDKAQMVLERMMRNHPEKSEVYYPLSSIYIAQKEYDKAYACYDSIEHYAGNSPELVGKRIELYDIMGDTATAIATAEELVEKNPLNIYYMLYLSDIYRYYSRQDDMLATLNKIERLSPGEAMIYPQRASYYLLSGDTTAYREEYDKLIANDKIDYRTKLDILNSSYLNEAVAFDNDSTILSTFGKLVDYYPYENLLRERYAMLLLYTQRLEEGAHQLSMIAENDVENAGKLWTEVMNIYSQAGNSEKVIEAGEKALKAGVNNCTAYLFLSNAYIVKDSIDRGKELIEIGLGLCDKQHNNERSYFYAMLGDIHSSKEMLNECYQYYDSALVYNPQNAMVLNNYAYKLATNNGDLLKAENMSAKSLQIEPDNATFIDTYAWVLFKKESYTLARIYMERAIDKMKAGEENAEYYEHYGDILFFLDEVDAAIEQWTKALEADPSREKVKEKIERKEYIE